MLLLGSMRAEGVWLPSAELGAAPACARFLPQSNWCCMTRGEIGSYLGMKLETVSRTFSKFVERGIIEVQNSVRILDTDHAPDREQPTNLPQKFSRQSARKKAQHDRCLAHLPYALSAGLFNHVGGRRLRRQSQGAGRAPATIQLKGETSQTGGQRAGRHGTPRTKRQRCERLFSTR